MADLHVVFSASGWPGRSSRPSGTLRLRPRVRGALRICACWGGISGKGLTLNGQPGNEGERLYETPSG